MHRDAKRLFPVEEHERRELAQRFCMSLRNAQVYGSDHTVSASSILAFYDYLVGLLDRFPEIEFSLAEGKVLLNGQACELRTADDVLCRRMRACELETFAFLDSVTRAELKRFLVYLGTGAEPHGVDGGFTGIRISDSVYARISADDVVEDDVVASKKAAGLSEPATAVPVRHDAVGGVNQFDLDSMLLEESPSVSAVDSSADAFELSQHVTGFVAQKRMIDQEREKLVRAIMGYASNPEKLKALHEQFLSVGGEDRDWDTLCRIAGVVRTEAQRGSRDRQIRHLVDEVDALRAQCESGQLDACSVGRELAKIRGSLDSLMDSVHTRADSLVEKVDADRTKVAELEDRARASGSHLHLSREELLASLAEINQELAQPLTVSSALLELLSSGKLGPVEAKQQELVSVATDSLARLEVVVKYLQRLSGVPVSLSPNRDLLSEVYSDKDH